VLNAFCEFLYAINAHIMGASPEEIRVTELPEIMQPARDTFTNRVIPLRTSLTGIKAAVPLTQAKRSRQVRIGKILLTADLISQDCLHEALTIAQELQQPIGKVLTSTQQITDRDLQSALLAQSMLAEGLVEEHLAMETLKMASREGMPFSEALALVQNICQKSPVASELEELLLSSGMLNQQALDEAKRQSLETGLSLGGSLMSMRSIVFAHLNFVFECITLIGQGRITKQIAVRALADIKRENIDLGQALQRQRISPKTTQSQMKLGDLLTAGSVITEKESLSAVEQALSEKRLIGDILVKSGMVSAELLQDSLDMQGLVLKGVISKDEAAFVLRQVVSEKKALVKVLRDRKSLHDDPATAGSALDLLIKAKLVEVQAIPQAMAKQNRFEMDALKALVASDMLSGNVCRAAIENARRVDAGELTQQEAVTVLHHCDRSRCEVEQAANELGLNVEAKAKAEVESRQEAPNKLPSWQKSCEFVLAIIAVLAGMAGGIATFVLHPSSVAGYLICGVVLAVGLTFLALGKFWEGRVQDKKREIKQQEESAKQQVNRLVKIRAKETY
jgi:hypothetical protein